MTTYKIDNIRVNLDRLTYSEHGLNCFIVPKYLALDSFPDVNRDLLYIYYYLYNHYNLLNVPRNLSHICIQPYDSDTLENHVLNNILGVELIEENVTENLWDRILEYINEGCPVLIPTLKGNYYYWNSLNDAAGGHLLLIKGYETQSKGLIIQDAEQTKELFGCEELPELRKTYGSIYTEFYIPYTLLQESHESYGKKYNYLAGRMQIMRRKSTPAIKTTLEAFSDIVGQLTPYKDRVNELLQPKYEFLINYENIDNHIITYINSQQILIHTLDRILSKDEKFQRVSDEVRDAGIQSWEAWKLLLTYTEVLKRKNTFSEDKISQLYEKVVAAETKFINLIIIFLGNVQCDKALTNQN